MDALVSILLFLQANPYNNLGIVVFLNVRFGTQMLHSKKLLPLKHDNKSIAHPLLFPLLKTYLYDVHRLGKIMWIFMPLFLIKDLFN